MLISFNISLYLMEEYLIDEHPKRVIERLAEQENFKIFYAVPLSLDESWFFVTTKFDTSKYPYLVESKETTEDSIPEHYKVPYVKK